MCRSILNSLTLTLVLCGAPPEAERKGGPDLTSPAAALRAFYSAVSQGDAKAAQAAAIAGKRETDWIAAQIKMNAAHRHFAEAGVAKFGKDEALFQVVTPAEQLIKKLDVIPIDDRGDTAQWAVNPREPLQLVKKEGRWKIHLTASFAGRKLPQVTAGYAAIAKDMEEVASQIEKGKFGTVEEVQTKLRRRQQAMEPKEKKSVAPRKSDP